MGTLNSRRQEVHAPIAGVALSHLTTLRLRFATVGLPERAIGDGFPLGGPGLQEVILPIPRCGSQSGR